MTSRLLVIATLALAGCTASRAADSVSCPATISTRQQLSSAAAGWTAMLDDAPHDLAGITFYDGAPSEKASLVYDQIKRAKTQDVATWTFAQQKSRAIWLVCSYAGTVVQLSRSLPPQITMCTAAYDPQEHVAGLPAIKKIDCR